MATDRIDGLQIDLQKGSKRSNILLDLYQHMNRKWNEKIDPQGPKERFFNISLLRENNNIFFVFKFLSCVTEWVYFKYIHK